jgi:hypothetical protein
VDTTADIIDSEVRFVGNEDDFNEAVIVTLLLNEQPFQTGKSELLTGTYDGQIEFDLSLKDDPHWQVSLVVYQHVNETYDETVDVLLPEQLSALLRPSHLDAATLQARRSARLSLSEAHDLLEQLLKHSIVSRVD